MLFHSVSQSSSGGGGVELLSQSNFCFQTSTSQSFIHEHNYSAFLSLYQEIINIRGGSNFLADTVSPPLLGATTDLMLRVKHLPLNHVCCYIVLLVLTDLFHISGKTGMLGCCWIPFMWVLSVCRGAISGRPSCSVFSIYCQLIHSLLPQVHNAVSGVVTTAITSLLHYCTINTTNMIL